LPARLARRWLARVARTLAVVAVVSVLLAAGLLAVVLIPTRTDPTPGFDDRKGRVATVHRTGTSVVGEDRLTEVSLVSSSGLRVELTVRVPPGPVGPRPLVVMLAGQGTGRDAVRYTASTRGIVVAALSYPYYGDKDAGTLALILDLPAIQRALLDTIPAVMLATDWLTEQPYVDPRRVELAGGSFGAFLVPVAGALDPRFRRVWLVHGGGDPALVLEHGLRENIRFRPARRLAARLLAAVAYAHHLAPEHWVGRIAPRPVIVISASDDESIPRESVAKLHAALGRPSEVIWMSGGHVTPSRETIIESITDLVFERIVEEGPPESSGDRHHSP
jgi:dienelactone hydrolase